MSKIYIEEFEKEEKTTVNDVLDKLINGLYGSRSTVYEDGSIQCESGCNRSIGDITKVVKTYFEDISTRDIYKELFKYMIYKNSMGYSELLQKSKDPEKYKNTTCRVLYMYCCPDIDELVVIPSGYHLSDFLRGSLFKKEHSADFLGIKCMFDFIFTEGYVENTEEFEPYSDITVYDVLSALGLDSDTLEDIYDHDNGNTLKYLESIKDGIIRAIETPKA